MYNATVHITDANSYIYLNFICCNLFLYKKICEFHNKV